MFPPYPLSRDPVPALDGKSNDATADRGSSACLRWSLFIDECQNARQRAAQKRQIEGKKRKAKR
jgi:hypothetical protein